MNLLSFTTVKLDSEGRYVPAGTGSAIFCDISAIVTFKHAYHSFRQEQELSQIYLAGGAIITAYETAESLIVKWNEGMLSHGGCCGEEGDE